MQYWGLLWEHFCYIIGKNGIERHIKVACDNILFQEKIKWYKLNIHNGLL